MKYFLWSILIVLGALVRPFEAHALTVGRKITESGRTTYSESEILNQYAIHCSLPIEMDFWYSTRISRANAAGNMHRICGQCELGTDGRTSDFRNESVFENDLIVAMHKECVHEILDERGVNFLRFDEPPDSEIYFPIKHLAKKIQRQKAIGLNDLQDTSVIKTIGNFGKETFQ